MRGRLAILYGGLFIASGVVLLAITYVLVERTFPVVNQKFTRVGSASISGGLSNGRSFRPTSPAEAAALVSQIRNADLHQLLVESSIALAVMAIVSIALGWFVAGRVLRPLRMITAATRRISEDNLHQRLAMQGPNDELKELSDTIDELLARMEGAFDAQRRFVANASHELRTPLTVGRALLEMILSDPDANVDSFREVCTDVLESGKQQEVLIEALLILARSQRGLDRRNQFDLAVITTAVAQTHESTAASRGLRLDVSVRPASMSGDSQLIERLVSNLVENALEYNLPDGSVQIIVENRSDQIILTVTNTGPVVPADQISRLLHPFQRITMDRAGQHDGHGLGLSIVAAIAHAHGAVLNVRPREVGGLDIEVRFDPADQSGDANGHGNRTTPQRPTTSSTAIDRAAPSQ